MTDETPPKKKRGFFSRCMPTTVAGKAAVATALVLWLTLIVVWLVRRFAPQSIPLSHAMSWSWMLIEFLLVLVIPVVLYWGLRRWNQVIEGMYPDIDHAWQTGIKALQANGVSVVDQPIFLILGSSGTQLEHGLMNALGAKLSVVGIPDETGMSHAMQWYASPDAIYLFFPGCSSLSALMGRWTTSSMTGGERLATGSRPVTGYSPGPVSQEASQPKAPASDKSRSEGAPASSTQAPPVSSPSTQQAESYLGTIQLQTLDGGQSARQPQSDAAAFSEPPGVMGLEPAAPKSDHGNNSMPQFDGTIVGDQLADTSTTAADTRIRDTGRALAGAVASTGREPERVAQSPTQEKVPQEKVPQEKVPQETGAATKAAARGGAARSIALPASLDTSAQLPRLRYACKLLRRIRRPRCGINGIVTLIPFGLSRAGSMQISALAQSARGDVATIQETLRIRCPVTAMLVGLEQDKGFTELVRRLQPDLLSRRLGGRFDLRSRPTPQELNTHSDRLCDAFEDWVYRLFGKDDALAQHRGNRKLYGLISRIRHELKPRLRIVLGKAFGCDDGELKGSMRDDSVFFSGCYFAASGDGTGQPAFVKGVLGDKLVGEQSQVEWTPSALRLHACFRGFAILGWIATAILTVFLLSQWFAN